jgi:predicted transcriptional regulator
MKKITTFLMIGATVALLALPVAATTLNNDALQDPCSSVESKNALYQDFLKNRKDDQAKAYDAAKKYLACPAAAEVTEEQQKIIDYLKKWTTAYDEGAKAASFDKVLWTDKNYPEAFKLGADRLAKNPDDTYVMVALGTNGYLVVAKNPELTAQALDYARKALQLLESGKTLETWGPLNNKETALAYLNFTAGTLTLEKDPTNALKNLIKAAQYETPLKKSPFTYAYIAGAYETGPYAKQSEQYKALYGGKDETPESKLALANINQLVDRMIDGYARAVALAGTDPNFAKQKPVWQESLTTWYKYLHNNSTDGMDQYVAGVVAKPLPPEPTPLTSLPTPAPASTPTGTSGTAGATNGNGTSSTTAPAGTTQPASKASTMPASPSSKPASPKPDRPRN